MSRQNQRRPFGAELASSDAPPIVVYPSAHVAAPQLHTGQVRRRQRELSVRVGARRRGNSFALGAHRKGDPSSGRARLHGGGVQLGKLQGEVVGAQRRRAVTGLRQTQRPVERPCLA